MLSLADLKSAVTLHDVAKLLDFKPAALAYILFKQPSTQKYKTFEIPKRNGGTRVIKAPADSLKLVQSRLSVLLQDCLDEINRAKNSKDKLAHGFKRHRSIITNAHQHRKRRYVFNLDLEDFFPSIHFGRVRGFFIKDKNFALEAKVATVLAQIACHDNALPQGSPCSPVISNLIAHLLDIHLVRLASTVRCTYSRYADDLTFSTNKKQFPKEIAQPVEANPHVWIPGIELQRLIKHSGFRVNPSKTRMQYRNSRQDVTGLLVNQKINVRPEYRHSVRAMVHRLFSTGSFELYRTVEKDGKTTLEKRPGTLNELHGRLGFIDGIDLHNRKEPIDPRAPSRLSSKELIYRQFLNYKDFYIAETPVIICEGETDNIYLTHAIRSLAAEFPELATIDAEGKIHLSIRLYKYRRTSTGRVLGIHDGGTSHLSKFIANYKKDTARFHAPGLKSPIIILYDNDSGAGPICKAVMEAARKPIKNTDPYSRVVQNLFVVPTPLLNSAKESKIEDFFDAATKATKLGDKTFNANNTFDNTKHYGKKVFAEKVVEVKAGSINFSGFRPLLTNLTLVIKAYAESVSIGAQQATPEPPED
jgi:retron-type reverse transcriptase